MKRLFYLLGCICLLCSCEYQIHENYVEIEQPQDSIYMSVDLNALTDGKTILLNKEAVLHYSLSAFGKEIKYVRFKMGDKLWASDDIKPNGGLYINSAEFPSGTYTLECDMFVLSGSGSIADQLEAEGAAGKMSWPVVIDYGLDIPGMFSSRTNEEGFLELSWPQLQPTHLKLKSYAINRNYLGYYDRIIVPAGQNNYVDKEMVGGEATYDIEALLDYENKEELIWPIGNAEISDNFELRIISSDLHNITIHWKTPYKAHLSFQIDEDTPFTPNGMEGTFDVPVTCFGSSAWWNLSKVAVTSSPVDSPSKIVLRKEYEVGSPGVELPDERGGEWTYNAMNGLLYVTTHTNLNSYSPQDVKQLKTYQLDSYWYKLLASPVSNKIVAFNDQTSIVLDGNTLTPITNVWHAERSSLLGLTNDEKLVSYSYAFDGISCTVAIHRLDGTKVNDILLRGTKLQLSQDGKFLLYQDDFDLKLLNLKDYQITGSKVLPLAYATYSLYRFNPVFPNQLLVQMDGQLDIYSCPDFNLLRQISLTDGMELKDIDPTTGNLLVYNNERLMVLDSQTGKELLTLKASSFPWIRLMGNTLISYDGFVFNIEKYLQQ